MPRSPIPAHGAVRAVFDNQDVIAPGEGTITGVRAADFNNDGKADLAVLLSYYQGSRIFVYLGQGNGEFSVPVVTPVSAAWRWQPPSSALTMPSGPHNFMRHLLVSLALFSVIVARPVQGAVRAVFANQDLIAPGDGAIAGLRAADFNNDGKPDLAVLLSHYQGSRVFVYLGRGDGEFDAPVTTSVSDAARFDIGDLNGDGILDLAVAWEDDVYDNRIQTYHGAGNGSFTLSASKTVTHSCWETTIALGDVTSDGRLDVLTCGLTVFPNLGGGTLGTAIETSMPWRGQISVADANGDGRQDVFFGRGGVPEMDVLLGNGNGTFSVIVAIDAPGLSAIADFDANGRADVVFLDEWRHDLVLRFSTANGTFPTRTSAGFLTESRSASFAVDDMNGDGRLDIVAGQNGLVSVYLANADSTPGPPSHYFAASDCSQLAIADFDGDGKKDLVTGGAADPFDRPVVSIFRGGANGTLEGSSARVLSFVTGDGYGYGVGLTRAALFDATGDGKLDAVSVSSKRPAIAVLPGNGDGTTAAPILTSLADVDAGSQLTPVFADFNDDGRSDVLVGDPSKMLLHCWVANGDGTFHETAEVTASPISSSDVFLPGDFDGDGHEDVLRRTYSEVIYYPGAGDGTFAAPLAIASSWGQKSLAGDVNNDGRDDAIFAGGVLLGSASRTFTPVAADLYSFSEPSALVDLNADGNLDLVLSDFNSNTTTLVVRPGRGDGTFGPGRRLEVDLRGSTHPIERGLTGDFNGDGLVDLLLHTTVFLGDGAGSFKNYARFRYAVGPTASAAGDVDGNGTTDILFVSDTTSSVGLVRTRITDSREVAFTLALVSPPASIEAGVESDVSASATGLGVFLPTGGVAFSVDDQVNALAEFVGGVASGVVRSQDVGSRTLVARFGGDDVYAAQASAPTAVEITRAFVYWAYRRTTPEQPNTKDEIRVVGPLTSALTTAPTGTVSVSVDGVVRGTGLAPAFDINVGMLPTGWHSFRLDYEGDSLHLPYHHDWLVNVVKPNAPIALSVLPNASAYAGEAVTLTATFADPSITGTVKFSWGGGLLGYSTISGGVASFTTSTLRVGSYGLFANYAGNAEYAANYAWQYFIVFDRELPSAASSLWILTPCRVLDTRGPDGPYGAPAIPSGAVRSLQMAGNCGVPFGARAVAINITAVQPTQIGFLTIFPGASSQSGTSTINYRTGKTRANSAIVPLSAGGILNIYNSGPHSQHMIIDVTGYFQ